MHGRARSVVSLAVCPGTSFVGRQSGARRSVPVHALRIVRGPLFATLSWGLPFFWSRFAAVTILFDLREISLFLSA